MFKHYFKTALRNFWRRRVFSGINVFGLSIGISSALVIFLIANYEFSFDKFQKDPDKIYRVVLDLKFNGEEGHSAGVQAPLSSAIQNEITGIDKVVPVMQFQGDGSVRVSILRESEQPVIYKKQKNIVFTNPDYFQLIHHEWLAGTEKLLKDPFTVVLSKSKADLYFPGIAAADVVGKQLIYNDLTVTVSGIVRDLNEQTSFLADEFISFATIAKTGLKEQFMMDVWNDWMAYSQVYVKLSEGTDPLRTEVQLKKLLNKYHKDANKDMNNSMSYHLQALNDLHFNKNYTGVGQRIANKSTLYGLLAIGCFLLLLGCINFINLTTAQSSQRAKEIGIRKTMGSSKRSLTFQFLGETLFVTIIATVLSIILVPLLMKMFEDFIPQGLSINLLYQAPVMLFLVSLVLLVSFLSGIYPALVLSGFKAILVLKDQSHSDSSQTRNVWIRKSLTVSQFVIAQFFVIATLMVSKQINYSINSDLGFNKEAIINFNLPRDTVASHGKVLLDQIRSIPGVSLASAGFLAPAIDQGAFTEISYNNGKEEIKPNVQIRWGDPHYINVYGIKLAAGRNVYQSDTVKEFLVNESYARALGFSRPQDAIDKTLLWNNKNVPIVGIVKDFHEQSLHAQIGPIVIGGAKGSFMHIKLKPNDADGVLWANTINEIKATYSKMYPEGEFNYEFFDDSIAGFYKTEQNTVRLLKWATGLSILISCLGLLGLVIYTTNVRTKEIGIRKVLGASVANLVSILSGDFVKLVGIAFLIAAPLAWWALHTWMVGFAYRTDMSWWIFAICAIGMTMIALLTLSIQIIRSAMANPVESLRNE